MAGTVNVEEVVVEYPIYDALRLFSRRGRRSRVFRALDAVSVRCEPGERVALLGRNGAGKTTLLKTIAGVYTPAQGRVAVSGHVRSLININIGMSLEATGYENIMMAGLLLGYSPRAIREVLLPDVERFVELGEFLARPLSTYSAGMAARLSFAIATTGQPDVLLADEVIGAGDAEFVKKARARLDALWERASVVIVASHDEGLVRSLCNRGLVLEHGRVAFDGPVEEALRRYLGQRSAA